LDVTSLAWELDLMNITTDHATSPSGPRRRALLVRSRCLPSGVLPPPRARCVWLSFTPTASPVASPACG
jgi:hypothetical protein